MTRDYTYIGSSPADESCAQVGAANYHELSKLELAAYKLAIIQKLGEPPEGAAIKIKDGELVCVYDVDDEKAADYAQKCESDAPLTWEEAGMKAPRLDDPEFTKNELIPVPEKGRKAISVPSRCDLSTTNYKSRECAIAIGNEYFDASLPALGGTWANVCPACFGACRGKLGTGMGQHFKKATDGNFYKVEG